MELVASELRVAFGALHVLAGVSFTLREGDVVLLRGANGAGKSLLLDVVTGFRRPDGGCVSVGGRVLVDRRRARPDRVARAGVGRLWQDIRVFPSLTAFENVLLATPNVVAPQSLVRAWCSGVASGAARALDNLERVGLKPLADRRAADLSVGQMKRVAIARLLQAEAAIVLLDEPFAGLDARAVDELVAVLDGVTREPGRAVLLVEHRWRPFAARVTRHWTLANGRINEGEAS